MSRSDPHDPKGGVPAEAAEAYVWGNLSEWRREAVLISLELAGKPLIRIENHKLDWGLERARTCELG